LGRADAGARPAARRHRRDGQSARPQGRRHPPEAHGAELRYLPPYSPDLNPIEQAFAKLKALLRKAAERTVDGLWNAIGRLLDLFPPDECNHYLAHSGYPRSA
jgi:transposase